MKKLLSVFLFLALLLGCDPGSATAEPTKENEHMPGLSPLALEFRGGAEIDALNFGVLPRVYSNATSQISVSVWGYVYSGGYLVSFSSNSGGVRFAISGVAAETPDIRIYSNVFNSAPGRWESDVFDSVLNEWHLYGYTFDLSSPANDPIFYVDGAAIGKTEVLTPAGTAYSRAAVPLIIGNRLSATEYYDDSVGGILFDARVYNRILTAAEMTTLYNGGTPSVSAGYSVGIDGQANALYNKSLVFHGFAVRTEDLASYTDVALPGKVFDAQYKAVSEAMVGTVTGRSAP